MFCFFDVVLSFPVKLCSEPFSLFLKKIFFYTFDCVCCHFNSARLHVEITKEAVFLISAFAVLRAAELAPPPSTLFFFFLVAGLQVCTSSGSMAAAP